MSMNPISRLAPTPRGWLATLALCLCAAAPAHAGSLEDLKAALAKLQGQTPVKAVATARVQSTNKDDDEKARQEAGSATVALEDGPLGLRLIYSPDLLAKAHAESAARQKDSKAATPTRTALNELTMLDVSNLTNAAAVLARKVDTAQLKSERKDTLNGQPVRVLSLELAVDKNQKFVKSASSNMDVWIDAEGRPLMSRSQSQVSGRAYMVITFDMQGSEEKTYTVAGDRLVVTRQDSRQSGSGAGQSGDSRSTISLALQS
jgi:hypothetical protein